MRRLLATSVLVALLGALLGAAPAPARQARRLKPFDYTKIKGLSQPVHDKIVKKSYMVPMADGVELYVEVTRPKGRGRYPVIMEASPYHGTLADREGTRILPEPKDEKGNPLGLTGFFAPRGYAVVMVDLRGTGRSQGCLDHLGPKDASDLKTIVEWAASRRWSNGRVGMTGHSYVGSTPSVAAAQDPKGLATIVPSAGLASMYHHQFQNGVPYYLQWMGTMWSYSLLSTNRHLPPGLPPVFGESGDNFGNDMQYFGCGWKSSSLTSPGDSQLSGEYTWWHAERDWERGATNADIPIFMVHGVNDNAARVAAMDWFTERNGSVYTERVGGRTVSGDKIWLGQWDHGSGCCPTRRGIQWPFALLAWFDHHLKGKDVPTGPPVEVFMSHGTFSEATAGDRDEIFTAETWPPPARNLNFYPRTPTDGDTGLLSSRPPKQKHAGEVSFTGDPLGFSSPKSTDGATFATPKLRQDMVLIGVPRLRLSASVSSPRVHLIANLFDESPNGDWRRISQFAINPELREGLATPKPVVPGERYDMRLEGFAMAHHLRKGHRLVLRVTTSDPDKVPTFAVDPQVTVYTGPGATQLTVPLIEDAVLYPDDVPLTLESAPAGPAQPGYEATVTTGAPGAGVRQPGVTSVFYEFEVKQGFDNARTEIKAVVDQPADVDLYLQRRNEDGSWSGDIASGASGSLSEEVLTAGRLEPGTYRVEVHNWAGPPANNVSLTVTFFNQDGEPGGRG